MNRKPIFDAVRKLCGGRLSPAAVKALDAACDEAEAASRQVAGPGAAALHSMTTSERRRPGAISQRFESGSGGPGTVSTGRADPGGVSYGTYQLSTNAGTLQKFMASEGKPWAAEFGTHVPGTAPFTTVWKAIARREPGPFGDAQHDFIHRTHYVPALKTVEVAKGIALDTRHDAVREACWSVCVQHRRSADILITAINAADPKSDRNAKGYDRLLVNSIYDARIAYVRKVAENKNLKPAERQQLIDITNIRYPQERSAVLAMFDAPDSASGPSPLFENQTVANADGTINGNVVAAANGVLVKSSAVKISALHAKMAPVIVAVAKAATTLGLPQPVITSGNDGKHKPGSLHGSGRALDFRGNNISDAAGAKFRNAVAAILGKDYDVLFEIFPGNPANDHLHVEYDPD